MIGKKVAFKNIPFFWTRNYEKAITYVGHCEEVDEIHIEGSLENNDFIAYFIKGDKVEAISS